MSWLRIPLLHFLAIGALLFGLAPGLDRALDAARPPATSEAGRAGGAGRDEPGPRPIRIDAERVRELRAAFAQRIGRPPTPDELARVLDAEIDEELLYREALARGLLERDGGVRTRLIQKMLFLDGGGSPAEAASLLERALDLGLQRDDVVVRRILVQKMRLLASHLPPSERPDAAAIAARHDRSPERWREADRLTGVHVFLSADRRPGRTRSDAEALRARLAREAPPLEAAVALGDPFPLGARLGGRSAEDLTRRFGPGFGERVFALEDRRWQGPVDSAYGSHLLWIEKREPGRIPPLEAVADRIRHELVQERRDARLRAYLRELRARTPVIVEPAGRPTGDRIAPTAGPGGADRSEGEGEGA